MRHFLVLVLLTVSLAACAGLTFQLPQPESSEAQLYREKCSACHSMPHPSRHTPREWDHMLNLMETIMEDQGQPMSSEEKAVLYSYLQRNAR